MPEWIVDGNNVMGSRADGWWRDRRGAQRRLVDELERFAEEHDEPVTVIFDGPSHDTGGAQRVAVRFARRGGRDAADDDIAAPRELSQRRQMATPRDRAPTDDKDAPHGVCLQLVEVDQERWRS